MKKRVKLELKKSVFVIGCIIIGGVLVSLGISKWYLVSFFLGSAFFTIMLDLFDYLELKKQKGDGE